MDKLEEIKKYVDKIVGKEFNDDFWMNGKDIQWLIAEIERLREQARLREVDVWQAEQI